MIGERRGVESTGVRRKKQTIRGCWKMSRGNRESWSGTNTKTDLRSAKMGRGDH